MSALGPEQGPLDAIPALAPGGSVSICEGEEVPPPPATWATVGTNHRMTMKEPWPRGRPRGEPCSTTIALVIQKL